MSARGSTLQAKIRPSLRCAVYLRGGRRCAWCALVIRRRDDLEIDHVIPRAVWSELLRGAPGLNHADNLVPACSECNLARGGGEHVLIRRLHARRQRLSEAWQRVLLQIQAPLDRAAARELVALWYPWESERVRRSNTRRAATREALAEGLGGEGFPFGELAQDQEGAAA